MKRSSLYEPEREQDDRERYYTSGPESYEQRLDRYRDEWRREIDNDLDNERRNSY